MFSAYQSIFMPSVHGAQGNNIVPPHVTCGMVGLRPFYNSEATSASMIVRKRSHSEIELKLKSTSVHKKTRRLEPERKLNVQYQRDIAPLAIIFKPNTTARPSRPPLRSRRNSRTSRPHLPSPPISPTTPSPSKSGSVGSAKPDKPQRKHDRRVRRVIPDE
ncbi:hypothetical protein BDF22DRAFT_778631 [Syncephalis plumigaleata]|nr:hypothetical protein BDF22DRAFT_778631 [Syncephalis plumigaleata]